MTTITAPLVVPQDRPRAARWGVLLGAVIVQLILGTVYGYSIFWKPLHEDIFPQVITRAQAAAMTVEARDLARMTVVADEAAAAATRETQRGYLKYAFSICILSFAVVMVPAGRLQDVRGPRFTATFGAVLMGGGFILAGLMEHPMIFYAAHAALIGAIGLVMLSIYHSILGRHGRKEMPMLEYFPLAIAAALVVLGVLVGGQYVGRSGAFDKLLLLWGTIGFLAGAGIGFAYVCPIAALIKWFPDRKGLVSGIAVAGFGFGAYLFKGRTMFGALGFIDRYDAQTFFVVHGIVCLIAVSLGAALLSNPPGTPKCAANDTRWQDTLRRPAFYVLWLMFFSGAVAGLMVIGVIKDFAGEQLVAARAAGGAVLQAAVREDLLLRGAEAVGWLAIFNAVGRIAWGFVSDRVGRTVAFAAMFALQAATMFLLARMQTDLALAVAASIVGFNFGGNFALFPSASADFFGARNLGANYGWLFTAYGVAGVAGITAGNAAKTMTGSYAAAFAVAGVLCILSAVLAVTLRMTHRRSAATA